MSGVLILTLLVLAAKKASRIVVFSRGPIIGCFVVRWQLHFLNRKVNLIKRMKNIEGLSFKRNEYDLMNKMRLVIKAPISHGQIGQRFQRHRAAFMVGIAVHF